MVSSGLDLTDSGWVGGGVLDGINAISAQLGLGFGLNLAITIMNGLLEIGISYNEKKFKGSCLE